MKHGNYLNHLLFLTATVLLIEGCVSRESIMSKEISKSGKNWSEIETTQEYKGPCGKHVIDKQSVYEKIQCIGKDGQSIRADTAQACIKKGGKIVDEIILKEETIKNK